MDFQISNCPFLPTILSLILSIYLILERGSTDPAILLAASFFFVICITDALFTRIPNWAVLALLAGALVYHLHFAGPAGMITFLAGFGVGLGLLIVPFLMGGMGAGDVKALAALGALIGPMAVFQVFLYLALIGGVMGFVHLIVSRREALFAFAATRDVKTIATGEKLKFPYAAAMAFGYFAYISWGRMI